MKRASRFLWIIALVTVLGGFLVSCEDSVDYTKGGAAYFKNANTVASKSVLSTRDDTENVYDIEFLVYSLTLKDDTQGGGVWVIAGNEGGTPGWYDIEGIQRANFGNQPQGRSHSCVLLAIAAVRINDKLYWGTGSSGMNPFDGNKEDITTDVDKGGTGFMILAGDKAKFGPGIYTAGDEKEIAFQGVANMDIIDEFIITIDTSKLHNDGELTPNWWECFSFVVR